MRTIAAIAITLPAIAVPLLALAWAAVAILGGDGERAAAIRARIGTAAAITASAYIALALALYAGRELLSILATAL